MRSLTSSRTFRSVRTVAVAGSLAVAALVAGAAPVSAGIAITPFTVTPDPVAPGGTLTIHGIGCSGGGTVALELFAGDFSGTNVEPGGPTVDNVDATPDVAGTWTDTMTAPATAKTGDKLTVWARCISETNNFTYVNVAVTVVDPADTTTTTTTAATTTTTTPAATSTTAPTAAAPATAVPATPTFTG
jgi:hypothetical protein